MSKTLKAWLRARRVRRGRVSVGGLVRASVTLIVIAGVLASQATAYSSSTSLNGVASWLAQRKVEIRCLTPQESKSDFTIGAYGAEAYVEGWLDPMGNWHPKSFAVFRHGYCERLLRIMTGADIGRMDFDKTVWAILVLVHESGHLRGHRWSEDEAKTQCWAMRHFRYTAQRLGVEDPEWLDALVVGALEVHGRLPEGYRLPDCVLPEVSS